MVYGKKEGTYYYFHENGEVAVKGEYKGPSLKIVLG